MIVDAQIHVWAASRPGRRWPKGGTNGRTALPQRAIPLGPGEVLDEMDAAGVDRAILVPPSWEGDRNDLALAAAVAHPNRLAVFGRIDPGITQDQLAVWRGQRGMLGVRVILDPESPLVRDGAAHPVWAHCAAVGVPIMIAPAGHVAVLNNVARCHPSLSMIVDHMGARVHRTGMAAFVDLDRVCALARFDNVAIKATGFPAYSDGEAPWDDVMPCLRRLYDRFGAGRIFWGSDLSRLPCPYPQLVDVFAKRLSWLTGHERELVMGRALLDRVGWPD